VIGDESEGCDCDEVICAGWGEPGREWTKWGWQNEEGSCFRRQGDAYLKERLSSLIFDHPVYISIAPQQHLLICRSQLLYCL